MISLVYLTNRLENGFSWFADSLAAQLDGTELEVVVVDHLHSDERAATLAAAVAERFPCRSVAPKPCAFSGPHRLTRRDFFTAANARNTGIVHTTGEYVAFVDDCSLLMPKWLSTVVAGSRERLVLAGAFQKRYGLRIEAGQLVAVGAAKERDSRWAVGSDHELVPVGGSALFGCSLALPRELLLQLNGFDELADPEGSEDQQLGWRIGIAGHVIHYARAMLTVESAELHEPRPAHGLHASLDPAAFAELLAGYGITTRVNDDGGYTQPAMVYELTYGLEAVRSIGQAFDLATLTPETLAPLAETLPQRFWFTGQPMSELGA